MERKYDVKVCSCGRIHFVPCKEIDAAVNQNKVLLMICGGCGAALAIGAEQDWDEYENKECWVSFCYDVDENFEITDNNFTLPSGASIYKVLYDKGTQVRMNTGYYANSYRNGIFYDNNIPNLYEIKRKSVTSDEVISFLDKWEKDHREVDMKYLLNHLSSDKLRELSHYVINGLDWSDTKYA